MRDAKKRLRRTMMFLNAQKPGLIKDPYIYGADSLMLDLEDAVAENQKDAARFSLFHALRTIDYHGAERIVRINGLDTPFWKEDIRCAVAGGCDGIRIPKTETAQDVKIVEQQILKAENEFGRPENSTLIMAAIESGKRCGEGVRNLRGFEKVVWYRTVRWRLHERSAYPHHGNRNRTDGSKTAACHRCTGSRCTVF